MDYKIIVTYQFYNDIESAYAYIYNRYKLVSAIKELNFLIGLSMSDLKISPKDHFVLDSMDNLYAYKCKNYLIIYEVTNNEIYLHRFVYAISDIHKRLKKT